MVDVSDYGINHRNLFLASSVELDEMNEQYNYRSAFVGLCCRILGSSKYYEYYH